MSPLSLVSIIIPTYNRAHLLGETLNSILQQTYTNWECIIVDDGSTDRTANVLEEYCSNDIRFQYHERPKDRLAGGNAARNYGFELSKGDYIQWFDDDDVMLPEFLKEKVQLFSNTINFVICSGSFYNGDMNDVKEIDVSISSFLFKDYVLWRLKILTPSVMFKTSFLKGKELFSNKISRGQETELFSRLFFQTQESEYLILNRPLFLYRQHTSTKTHSNLGYVKTFKESETYIAIENLKRSIIIRDKELIGFFYRVLVNFFFRAIENNHKTNAVYILHNLIPILQPLNKKLAFEFKIFGKCFVIMGRGLYKIEMYLKTYKFLNDA